MTSILDYTNLNPPRVKLERIARAASALLLYFLLLSAIGVAQGGVKLSPLHIETAIIHGSKMVIEYSRPSIRDPVTGATRRIFGVLVPYGRIWRTGADQVTTLVTSRTLSIQGVTVAPGRYSIYTLPMRDRPKLVLNKRTNIPGNRYYEEHDIGRFDLQLKRTPQTVQQLTITVRELTGSKGVLIIAWEDTQGELEFEQQ